MRAVPGQRERVLAVVRALKTAGIRVRNWKSFVQTQSQSESQENLRAFAFGRELQSLPQHHLTELDGSVPLFLVEVCEYLSRNLHTEGLFRKTGSLSRIRALRAGLERGERVFCPPHDASLQPCDVASVLKQFLRELPQPLIPADLQGPLCQAQTLDAERDPQGARDRATLLLTALLPPAHARTLQYLCTFLGQVAHRCDENRMEAGNLALVMAPNLLQCPSQPGRLTTHTEKQLDQQTAVMKALIIHADRIGVLPPFVLDSLGSVDVSESTPPADGAAFSKRAGLSVYSSLRRQRRRSVGEIFVDAFSKLKPARTPTGPPMTLEAPLENQLLLESPTPQSPSTVKRKASEETTTDMDGSAKKRRSLHDLRVDSQSVSSHSADGGPSPQAMKNNKQDLHPNVSKRKSQIRRQRKSYRPPKQEDGVHRRRRSLRFFTMSSSSNGSPALSVTECDDPESCLSACRKLHDDKASNSDSEVSLKIPFIVIDGPGTVIIGSEVDDDPDLLNCSFMQDPESLETFRGLQREDSEEPGDGGGDVVDDDDDDDDRWVLLEDGDSEVVVEYKVMQPADQTVAQPEAAIESPKPDDAEKNERPPLEEPKQTKRNSQKGPRPRRSISMPEVALDSCSDETDEALKEAGVKQPVFDGDIWSASVNLPFADGLSSTGGRKAGDKEKEGRDGTLRRKYGSVLDRKKDKITDSDPGVKRTHRLSMAERLRSFSALAALLRSARGAVPQFGHQRSTVRLRRQGARRFSRSFSHEGVPELDPGEDPQSPQAFVELSDAYADCEKSSPHSLLDGPTEHVQGLDVSQNTLNQASSEEDLTLVGSPPRSEESKHLQIEEPEFITGPRSVLGSDVNGHEPEFDLHKLLEQQCCVADQEEDSSVFTQSTPEEPQLDVHYNVSNVSPPSHQQVEPPLSPIDLHSFRDCTDSPRYSSFAERCTGSASSSPCKDIACLSFDGLISVGDGMNEKYSLSLDLSPPAFQFRQQGSRRRYRDSPRWPSHEVRMTTWKPLPL
ncbi:uncharacterized protein zgc:153345 isoform X2 [Pygocentrus nattereri]|uniref:uncharacterized protein zgc:153345 isoform X2 n=1 Tax=Pygocentrus nattereri TaxID=42514 RepID=UPI001890EFD7|nr:uncharacterized protein zgc:153345 isoform X2 [Pygocentrus nattereri]